MSQQGVTTNNQSKRGTETPALITAGVSFEHHSERDSLGIGEARPRLSWIVTASTKGWQQVGYEIELFGPDGKLQEQTGRVESSESVLVDWPFSSLSARELVGVRVRVWGTDGQTCEWSQLYKVETGLLTPGDWSAQFITAASKEDNSSQPHQAPLLRKEFEVRPGVAKARLYITALGLYEAQLNGRPVGDQVLAPGWTSYHNRLRYQTYDVTDLLREGPNALGVTLGEGWFKGRFVDGVIDFYGDRVALLAQLEISYVDGSVERIVTDETWRTAPGPILENNIYDGETYDARLEPEGWSESGFNDQTWNGASLMEWDFATLFAPVGPPVRRIQEVSPISITTSPSGRTILDFGQNLVGWLRITVKGEAGQTITLRHAEVLQEGELYTRPLRSAKATDRYTLRGGGEVETFEPHFTYHGFRYAEVTGWPGQLQAGDIVAVLIHSDMERTGTFECSDPLINRLHENVVWSMRGNFVDVPTDCPQRDERLGWTGDIQVFAPTATFLYDCAGFLSSWLGDVAADQSEDGIVPFVIPNIMYPKMNPAAAWGDAAVFVPWVLYQRFGDKGILANQFESMRKWVDHLDSLSSEKHLWDQGFQFGDWLDPTAPPEAPALARTSPQLVATAYFARSAEIVGQAAKLLGKQAEADKYLELAAQVREGFNNEYVTPGGRMVSDATTAYSLALEFDLLPTPEQRRLAGQRLLELVRDSGYRISTGFVGTPLICDALISCGEYAAAYRLLTQKENPSWLNQVIMGATTIWERWDSMLPDGTVNPGEMTSFNHYALGAVADWLHRVVGGLALTEPGYRRLEIRPVPGGGITSARATHRTPYGIAECFWQLVDDQIEVRVEVPANTTALVVLPGKNSDRQEERLEVGSGSYSWTYTYPVPKAGPAQLSLESPINDFLDDPESYQRVVKAISKHMPFFTNQRERAMRASGRQTLGQFLTTLPNGITFRSDIEKALAEAATKVKNR